MNHLTHIHLLLAAAALSAALFGCKKDPVEINPNFNPETDEVNAAFVMSVSTGSSRATKMSAQTVQKNNNFLGINDAKLILYADGTQPVAFVKSTDGAKDKHLYDLGPVFTPGAIEAENNASSSSNRVLQLTLPIGVDAALFYGKANNPTPGKAQGHMDFSHISDDPANTWFGAQTIIGGDTNVDKYDATGRLMIYAINTILATSAEGVASYTRNGYTNSAALPPISWKELGHQWEVNHNNGTDNPYGRTGTVTEQVFLAESMGQAYATFTHIGSGEYRAGSSTAVKAMMQSLYSVIKNTLDAKSLNDKELNVQRLAYFVQGNIQKFFDLGTWTYLDPSDIKTNTGISDADWANTHKFTGAENLNDYPYGTYGIPEGAAQLAFDKNTDKFSYIHPNNALVTPGATFEPRKYLYPAELTYYVNSPLWVTAKNDLSYGDYPNGTTNWDKNNTTEGSKWKTGDWTITKVASDTRGVAIRDEIKYGVAMLETNVAWTADAASGGLNDNRNAMTGETDRTISVNDAHIQLRGILIGGVHPRYNWQFIPRALTTEEAAAKLPDNTTERYGEFDGVIYDDAVPSASIPTASPNYTLVYDNYNYSDVFNSGNQNDVYVALEFVNGGEAFWGRDNLIPHDGVFYLGAKLTVAPKELNDPNSTQTITWPSNHQIPPINETTGASLEIPRVFIQSFLTKATFRIGVNSLKYAYYTVPNLASSQMSFGLSVDLSWESGYEYDLEFGANN